MKRIVILLVMTALFLPLSSASAALATRYADWTPLTGTSTDYTTTMQLSPTFPAAAVTTDSRAGQVGVQSGASSWFGATTPPGERYGSSRNQEYLNLRPRADNASSPSTTTYSFERATPLGWAFVLGDIDADQVRVTATRADGEPASATDLGFQSSFNLCGFTPRPSSCGSPTPTDAPTWDPVSTTLTGNDAARDTTGATGWFEPAVPLRTLTFEFTRRAGLPIYQTWFALRTQDLTGSIEVTDGTCDLAGATVEVTDQEGTVVDSTTSDASGAYAFTGLAASPGYRVGISGLPNNCLAVGPTSTTFDLSEQDQVVDFAAREIVPAAITGTVTAPGDGPVEGVTVTLTPDDPDGTAVTTVTDADGFYVLDGNPAGDYTLTVTAPDGYTRGSEDLRPTIPPDSEEVVDGQDFTLTANPTITGTVRTVGAEGEPLGGVTVELRDAGGQVVDSAVTMADGTYSFVRVPGDSTYTVAVPTPPAQYGVPPTQTFEVGTSDSADHDFALSRPGSVSGTVTEASGDPAAGVEVQVAGPDGFDETRTTDDAGNYEAGDLAPGTYTVSVDGLPSRTVVITESGENVGGIDFVLADVVEPTPPSPEPPPTEPPPAAAPGGTTPQPGGTAVLPDTGGPRFELLTAGLLMLVLGTLSLRRRRAL
ncbi:MSCRAMM family protein [Aeromicrobium sp. CF3.5]|uniref:MSCRAMM family protein n=1 Tax=Aeromicrobium sp. CF3.5 TaxID=3373078 RepID=UPI003EE65B1F